MVRIVAARKRTATVGAAGRNGDIESRRVGHRLQWITGASTIALKHVDLRDCNGVHSPISVLL